MEIDLNERLIEALKMVARNPQFGNIEVIKDFAALPPLWVRRSEIDQVFVNLISNAVQAMAGRGCLSWPHGLTPNAFPRAVPATAAGYPKPKFNGISLQLL